MYVLQIRGENGEFKPIVAIKGEAGDSAYEQAKQGGFNGTKEEFIAILNGLISSADATHYANFNNPHKVTKAQLELENVDNTSDADKPISTAVQEALDGLRDDIDSNTDIISTHADTLNYIVVALDGEATSEYGSIAIGPKATADDGSVAIGFKANADTNGTAIGPWAKANNSIQIGEGTNNSPFTLKVYGYELMDSLGKIPAERLPKPSGTYGGSGANADQTIQIGGSGSTLLITSSNNDIAFVHAHGARSYPCNGSDFSVKESNAKFVNGVLYLTNNSYAGLNATGVTYYFQVL